MANIAAIIRRRYLSNIPGDLTGGIVAAVVALPLALAFGEVSGMGAAAGVYGAIACGIFAAMFGGTPGQISGPTGPMTVVSAGMIATAADMGHNPNILFTAIIIAGFFQVILGVLRGGQIIHYIPYPVISGFMTGIGVIIISLQVLPLLGHPGVSKPFAALVALPKAITSANPQTLLIGLATLAVIYLLPRFVKFVPSPLVALVVGTGLAYLLGLDIPRIEGVPTGLPELHIPTLRLSELPLVMHTAVVLALLGSIDALLASVMVDRVLNIRHNTTLELIGQGIGNAVSGLIGGLPGAGANMRTLINIKSGGRTYLSGIIHGLILLSIVLGLSRLVEQIPLACLAGILIFIGISIMDYRSLRSLWQAPKSDIAVMLTVLFLTVFADLIIAVGIGMALASFLFMKKLSDTQFSKHGGLKRWIDKWYGGREDIVPPSALEKTYVYQFNGPLFFGEVKNFNDVLPKMYGYRYVILHLATVPLVDQSGVYALEDAIQKLTEKGSIVYLVNLTHEVRETLNQFGVFNHIPMNRENIQTFDEALEDIALAEGKKTLSDEQVSAG
ncbi:MAG TPA: SulP family inorganic anion transporter [Oculatellaceae cyanobacterium]|jgi:SulP family sulfate permease